MKMTLGTLLLQVKPETSPWVPEKETVSFSATQTPSIENYQVTYAAKFGEYPTVKLFTTDGNGNRIPRSEVPVYELVNGKVSRIVWDLPEEVSGVIVIS
jgi:hypothetical protein